MIREISQSQTVGHSKVVFQKKNVKKGDAATTSVPTPPVTKYSLNNIKANYMTKALSRVSFGSKAPEASGVPALSGYYSEDSIVKKLTDLPAYKLSKVHYYDDLANDVAILIGPNKNALLAHEEGVESDLLLHNFTRNILDGKYKNEGLRASNTDVFTFDVKTVAKEGLSPYAEILNIASNQPSRKKVVFVENFHMFVAGLASAGKDPKAFLREGVFNNTQIVGLVPKEMYNLILDGKTNLDAAPFKALGKADFDGLNAADTKDLLKKDARYTTKVLSRYKEVDLRISHNAIDELVDKSAASIDGCFPGKAVRVLDLTAAAKVTELHSHKPGTTVPITSSDVKRFFENHTGIVDGLKPAQGQFRLAENVKTKMADVGGISTLKEEIKEDILDYLKDPKKFAASGRVVPNGKLLTGPPGNGKTLLARAIAGETGIPFIAASGSEFVEKYVGVGAQRMRELFENARKAAAASDKKIAIIFIDEIDAFAKARGANGASGESESEKTLNQLLTEMDGFNKSSKTKVFVLAATNRKDIIDPALLRFGRFDGGIEVSAPKTVEDRLEILNIHARNKQFADEADKAKILNGAAKITEGMSGADLAGVMAKAAKVVSKRPDNQVMTYNDMIEGYLQVTAGPVKTSDSSLATKKMVVRHEAGHAVLIDTLKQEKISFITLDGRGEFLGAVFHNRNKEMPNFKSVIYSAATSYAGGHAEPGFDSTGHGAGVSADLESATKIIDKAIKKWGLGVYTPQISIGDAESNQSANLLDMYKQEVKKDINLFTKTAQTISKKVVAFHKDFLDGYVKKFEENAGKGGNNLSGEEFSKMREDWITKTGKTKQFKALQKEVANIVDRAYNANLSTIAKLIKMIKR
jgi:ATP-dependent metalloprotease FtsH